MGDVAGVPGNGDVVVVRVIKLNFRLSSQCKRRLTWSPERVDSINQKILPTNAHAHRDVFQARLPWKEMV